MQLPYVALAAVVGGNVRVGLEDNLYLERGVQATNGQLVERAVAILEAMNVRVLGPGGGAREAAAGGALSARSVGRRGRHRRRLGGRLVVNGVDVVVYDPHPEAERRVREVLANAERAWKQLTLAPRPAARVSFASSLEEAVRGADFVQESAPEDEALKRRLLAEIGAHASPDAMVVLVDLGPAAVPPPGRHGPPRAVRRRPSVQPRLPAAARRGRGGRANVSGDRRARSRLLRLAGHEAAPYRREIDGFVADRLLEALWREALWLVDDGVATVAEIDDAIRFGPGLRWAHMGTFLTYRIAGGEDGMRHFLAQFGPALQWPWTKLTDVPELTDELVDRIVAQSDAQAAGLSVRELERLRDDYLVALLQALRARRYAAGEVLASHEARLFAAGATATDHDPTRPLRLYETTVDPSWVDYNGHMTEARYGDVFRLRDRRVPALRRRRRHVPRGWPQRLHRRGSHPLSCARSRRSSRSPWRRRCSQPTRSGSTCSTRCSTVAAARRSRPASTCCCTSTRRLGERPSGRAPSRRAWPLPRRRMRTFHVPRE